MNTVSWHLTEKVEILQRLKKQERRNSGTLEQFALKLSGMSGRNGPAVAGGLKFKNEGKSWTWSPKIIFVDSILVLEIFTCVIWKQFWKIWTSYCTITVLSSNMIFCLDDPVIDNSSKISC